MNYFQLILAAYLLLCMSGCRDTNAGRNRVQVALSCVEGKTDVIRGQKCEREFTLQNKGAEAFHVERASTSCGCAVIQTGGSSEDVTISPGESLAYRLRIDTAQRLGPLHIGLMIIGKSADGSAHQVKQTVTLFVNPGWVTDKRICKFVQQELDVENYEDSFCIYATSPDLSYESITLSISDPSIFVSLEMIEDNSEGGIDNVDTTSLVGKALHVRPVAVCRLRTAVDKFTQREESLYVDFENGMTSLRMPVQFHPIRKQLECEPSQITLSQMQLMNVPVEQELVLRTKLPLDEIEFKPSSQAIKIVSTNVIAIGIYRIRIQLEGDFEAEESLEISSSTGNSIRVPILVLGN